MSSPSSASRIRFSLLKSRRVEDKVLIGFLAGLVFVVIFGIVTVRDTRAYLQGYDQLFLIDESINTGRTLLKDLDDAEAAQVNYLRTGDELYHNNFKAALAGAETGLEQIESMFSDDPALKGELPELHELIHNDLAGLARSTELGNAQDLSDTMERLPERLELTDNEKIRASINRILIVRNGDKVAVKQMLTEHARSSLRYLVCLTVLVLLLIAALYGMIMAQLREKRQLTKRLSGAANHDLLTHLPDRMLLMDWLEYSVAQARLNNSVVALLYLDLDEFDTINARFGREVGDLALVEIARRFESAARESDLVSRPGADEFAVLLSSVADPQDVASLASRLIESLNEPILPVLYDQIISVSVGIALYPSDGKSAADLLQQAEHAMSQAKLAGKHQYRFYAAHLQQGASRQSRLLSDLARALGRDELSLVYQPQMDLPRWHVVGVEALLRWNHPNLGPISPAEFIPLAETSGLIIPIGAWVIRTACKQAAQWVREGGPPLVMAVNIAPSQLRGGELIGVIEQALAENELPPCMLEIELTERVLAQHNATQAIKALKELGVRLSIDDFGTGYSSLNYLKRFAVDVIKLDQSFVAGLPHEMFDATITKTIISVAQNLGMGLIAEGVETGTQLKFLQDHGCENAQGYFFSRPLAPERVLGFVFGGVNDIIYRSA
ncbi:EAL domain-containing protein [Burkholderia sp. L27(2015)]|uniref:EAL domain-containing protein n=1 Tax=Burkholderia sp. L27(2015) TaxID=1641858 RepID=UPI00131B601D|nr:EAL domain-containing protein [Burkholderia sp. L27(2015)]